MTANLTAAVAEIVTQGYNMLIKAAEMGRTDENTVVRNSFGRKIGRSHPAHPLNLCVTLAEQAEVLINWTEADEAGYIAYVQDGLGATDGYFAPLARDAWKA